MRNEQQYRKSDRYQLQQWESEGGHPSGQRQGGRGSAGGDQDRWPQYDGARGGRNWGAERNWANEVHDRPFGGSDETAYDGTDEDSTGYGGPRPRSSWGGVSNEYEDRSWRQPYGGSSYNPSREGYRHQGGGASYYPVQGESRFYGSNSGYAGSYGSRPHGNEQYGYGQSDYRRGSEHDYRGDFKSASRSDEGYSNWNQGNRNQGSRSGPSTTSPDFGDRWWGGSASGSSSQQRYGKGPKGYRRSDDRLRDEISDQMMAQALNADDIEVSVSNGEVTLTGSVCCRSDKFAAEQIAERVMGVSDVINQLRVKKSGESSADTSKHSPSTTGSDAESGYTSTSGSEKRRNR